MQDKFYITTPIYYVNDQPHIGHLTTTLAADTIARFYRNKLGKENVFFLTGSDEHGAKIAESAAKNNQDPKEYCDHYAQLFQKNWDDLNISYDFFIRTTDPRHEQYVAKFLQKLYAKGDIYKKKYTGLYCVGCEKYITQSELVDGHCAYHPQKELIEQSEENYFFKLSKYQNQLYEALTNSQSSFHWQVVPDNKKQEILYKIEQGLEDVSISRAAVEWGIPVPWDNSQTVYVWIEALLNYYTATQFLPDKQRFWPADLHIVGKDISWFHNVIWQALLMANDESLPKKVLVHSFYISEGVKMSKSIGNVIFPEQLISEFGIEGTRYLILDTFPLNSDSDITINYLREKYNATLANGLGNLVQRISKLCERAKFENNQIKLDLDEDVAKSVANNIENYNFNLAFEVVWQQLHDLDKFIDEQKPWEIKDSQQLNNILATLVGKILIIAEYLKPLLPETATKIAQIFSAKILAPEKPLFPRIKV